MNEKVAPYLRPLYDAFYELLPAEKFDRYFEKGVIELAPLAYMRGRTLNDSFIILDEAQNTTPEQMKNVPDAPRLRLEGRRHGRHNAGRPARLKRIRA